MGREGGRQPGPPREPQGRRARSLALGLQEAERRGRNFGLGARTGMELLVLLLDPPGFLGDVAAVRASAAQHEDQSLSAPATTAIIPNLTIMRLELLVSLKQILMNYWLELHRL